MKKATLTIAALLLVTACSSTSTPSSSGSPSASSSASSDGSTGNITVLAAASLTETFTALGKQYEVAHPGTHVTFSFGGSSTLAQQITSGAPADVFAAASAATMKTVTDAGDAANPTTFAKNVLEIAVWPKSTVAIGSLADLPKAKVVLCAPQVPCGAAAEKLLAQQKITVKPVSLETDVKAALQKVAMGEADASLVYVTDVKAAGDKVKGVEIPANENVSTSYPIATLKDTKNAALAQSFVDYVLSDAGKSALQQAGFQAP